MNTTDIFIKRPVFATVLSLIILLVGIVCYFKLTLRQYPMIQATVLTVSTSYAGADSKLMEGFVTTPLETQLGSVNGIDFMSSSSSQGNSQITMQFKLNYDINTAIADVNSAVASARWMLPKDVDSPVVQKQDPNATPIVWMSFHSNTMSENQITDYLERVIQPRLETIDGVGQTEIFGSREYAMRIWLNPQKMAALGVSANDISTALKANNLQTPTGQIKTDLSLFDISANTGLTNATQFDNLVIRQQGNQNLVRIKDIGTAQLGSKNDDYFAIMNGKDTIFIGVIPKSTGNPLEVARNTQKQLEELKKEFPPGLDGKIVWDSSKFIAASIHEVKRTIIETVCAVIFIIFIFLGSLRTLVITAVTIPLSLIGAFGLMAAMGFTINTLTLLALVLAIGMVVDDAIVVSENIHRHLELGKSPKAAAILGGREIQFAIIAMTLTLVAVFAPIGFMSGLTGILFREFAFTLAGAVLISGFIALTLSPMMCSKLFQAKSQAHAGKIEQLSNKMTTTLASYYRTLLERVLQLRMVVIGTMALIFIALYFLYTHIPPELAPKEDMGYAFTVLSGPANANAPYMKKYALQLGKIYDTVPEMEGHGSANGFPSGINNAIGFLILKPWEERKRSVDEIIMSLFPQLSPLTGVRAFPFNPSSLPGATGLMPINFVIETTGGYPELKQAITKLLTEIRANPTLVNVDSDLNFDKTELDIAIDRNRAAILGISMQDIGTLLNIAFGEPTASQFDYNGRGYDVVPQVSRNFRSKPDDISNLTLRTASNELVPLSNLATITPSVNPRSLNHFQQLRSATITGSPGPGYTMGEALNYLEKTTKKYTSSDMRYDFAGQSRQFIDASSSMQQTFVFALLFIFLVLAAQFESFRSPFVVMFSVPLSILGALILLKITGSTMNIYTEIGLVTLVGLISKHGILMVEFANQLQEEGRNRKEAIIEAACIRFRPIIMTTMAMILGALPLTLSVGAGAVSRSQMGWTIVGGMAIGTLFTLFVVPTMYTFFATIRKPFTTGDAHLDASINKK